MRKVRNQQLPLTEATPDHPKAKELDRISEVLDNNNSIYTLAAQDLGIKDGEAGARGLTVEQVLRAAIVKKVEGYTYRELAFHMADSRTYRKFCRVGIKKSPGKSALQQAIKAISAETWQDINRVFLKYAEESGVEKGRRVRIDCTVVESNIHNPYDSELLMDSNRVLARLMSEVKKVLVDIVFSFADHRLRSKRRALEIMNAKNNAARKKPYRDLITITEKTVCYGEKCIRALRDYSPVSLEAWAVKEKVVTDLSHYLPLARQVICQSRRRVLDGESVPATEKIVSIFEPHTDIIRKDRRDTYYGHKICVTGGTSNLITDCVILEGNPADSTLTMEMLDRQNDIYGRYPLKVALDGGFASKDNLEKAKETGIKDVCFSKGRGLVEEDMCRSKYVYKKLRNFRAGIESGISWLKRSLGLTRCNWKGLESFKSYVWSSIVAANLLSLARSEPA